MQRILLLTLAFAWTAFGQASCPEPAGVGYRTVMLDKVITSVWYPSATPDKPYQYGPNVAGSVALNAAPVPCGRFPLVLFSHGYSGCALQSVFITEQLARMGYVVAAPNHADASCNARTPPPPQQAFGQPSAWNDQTYADRRQDLETVLTRLLANAELAPVIDAERIGGMGHSLGGYTMAAMAGGWATWTEPRLKAVLLLSPYIQPFLEKHTLTGLRAPVMYEGGTLDFGITPFVARAGGAYDSSPAPKFLGVLKGAGHDAWSDKACLDAGSVAKCLATVPNAALADAYGFAFFDSYLKQQARPLLAGDGPGLADYRKQLR